MDGFSINFPYVVMEKLLLCTFGFLCGGCLFKTSVYFCLGFPTNRGKNIPHLIGTHMFFFKVGGSTDQLVGHFERWIRLEPHVKEVSFLPIHQTFQAPNMEVSPHQAVSCISSAYGYWKPTPNIALQQGSVSAFVVIPW